MDARFMEQALVLAREAAADGEVPVGAVVVRGDTIVGRGRNRREGSKTRCRTPRSKRSTKHAKRSAAGGCGTARCM